MLPGRILLLGAACAACACASPAEPKTSTGPTVVVTRPEPESEAAETDAGSPRPAREASSFAERLRKCQRLDGESDLQKARKIFELGIKAFQTADYAAAAESFTQAYESTCSPALLYNLAITLQRVGRDADAVDALELYLEKDPSGARGVEVRELIEKLRKRRD